MESSLASLQSVCRVDVAQTTSHEDAVSHALWSNLEIAWKTLLSDDEAARQEPINWSEEDVVRLHWLLLQDISSLSNPATPLEEKLDTLRWIFSEREKDERPFSFVRCVQLVGCSPLSPIEYCGQSDVYEIRNWIEHNMKSWLRLTLSRYPSWVRDALAANPDWVESRLTRNPQCINEQVKSLTVQGDLFL